MNDEYVYSHRVRPENYDLDLTKQFQDWAQSEGISNNELLKRLKNDGRFLQSDRRYGGRFTENLEGDMLDVDKQERPHQLGKSLERFIEERSPDQEEDIYEWY